MAALNYLFNITSSADSVVLVTGGSGFLGQHVVGLLQSHAPHVTEIRILDVNPYENKLDYESTKPVKQYIGSITDCELVRRACQNVSLVIHMASIIDISLFPNIGRMEQINVQGTSVLLDISREAGVQRFIYCSSMSVIGGYDHIIDGTEETTRVPEKFIHHGYGSTKQKAEALVLDSNCDEFRTAAIRPSAIYGEEDAIFITALLKLSHKTGKFTLWNCGGAKHQMAYAGNVAWMFLCADTALRKDVGNKIGGHAFFAADDTPVDDVYEMRVPFMKACNYPRGNFKPPLWLLIYIMHVVYFFLLLLSPFMKINYPFGISSLKQMTVSFSFKNDKAKEMLGYKPLYTYEESFKRSMTFYKRFGK